jgi:pimeloyl-ACP methyl ester carboxylesterase
MTEPPAQEPHAQAAAAEAGDLAWHRFGDGPPLLVLHGGHGNWQHWLRNIEPLGQVRTLWIPDMPGYGGSARPLEPTLDSLVAGLLQDLARHIPAHEPIDLLGFSFGGLVAAHLAVQRSHVQRLALIGPAGHGTERRPRGELTNWREADRQGDETAVRAIMRRNLLQHMLHDEASVDETALRVHTDACRACRFHSRPISRAGGLQAVLDRFRRPTLLLWGEHDVTAVPEQLLPRLLAGHPHRQGGIVAGAGHWAQYEAAAQVNERLRAFLLSEPDSA